ncbi:MAG: glycosyltransferase family 2 protein [Vicinamibacterales bacterium]
MNERGATLDIVIVNYNTRDELANCLQSLQSHPPSGLGNIFVVDNASSDGSQSLVRDQMPQVTLLALDRNVGFAAANNVALLRSTASLVLLLNSDTVVPAGAIDTLVVRLEATGAVAVGPRLVDAAGAPEISFGPMLTPWTEWRQQRRLRRATQQSPRARRAVARWLARERDVDWLTGACLLVRREAAVGAGLLDERYFMYEEDVDFCAALRAAGGRIVFAPSAQVTHLRGRSAASPAAASGRSGPSHYDVSHVRFYEKHLPRWAPALRLWLRLRGRAIR